MALLLVSLEVMVCPSSKVLGQVSRHRLKVFTKVRVEIDYCLDIWNQTTMTQAMKLRKSRFAKRKKKSLVRNEPNTGRELIQNKDVEMGLNDCQLCYR